MQIGQATLLKQLRHSVEHQIQTGLDVNWVSRPAKQLKNGVKHEMQLDKAILLKQLRNNAMRQVQNGEVLSC